jgi:hypothetical protein
MKRMISLYTSVKEDIYNLFDHFSKKSKEIGRPVRKSDLLLDPLDHNLMSYLSGNVHDYYNIVNVSKLNCYREFGIDSVIFKDLDGCDLCRSFNGIEYSVDYLLNLFSSDSYLSHPFCDCDFIPVIKRDLDNPSNLFEGEYEGRFFKNIPIEYRDYIFQLVSDFDYKQIEVVYHGEDLVYESGDTLKILFSNELLESLFYFLFSNFEETEDNLSGEIFMYDGREVLMNNGKFFDPETGKEIEV